MRTPEEVRALIHECENAPYGAGQIALAEEAIRHADALDEEDLRFDARMAGTQAYHMGGEPAKAFVTFSWCLAEYDRDPGARTPWDDALLRWHFKWIVGSMTKFPEVPLERAHAVLDDMERRYRLGGHSMHAIYSLRHALAQHVGDVAATDAWYAKWCATPRDENSDCLGCDPTSKVEHLVIQGRDTEAIGLAEPVLAGELTCAEQPHGMLTELLVPYLRTGRLEQARDAHVRGYRGYRRNLADLAEIGQHIELCALTGNEARGLEILERHLDWLDRAPSPYAAQEFATAGALLLRRLVDADRGDLPIHRRDMETTAAVLASELAEQARQIAARFDARNGTTYQSQRVERRMSASPLVEYLPLSAVDRARAALGERAKAAPAPAPVASASEAGLDELLDRAEDAYARLDIDRALALWQLADERFGAAPVTTLQRGRIAEGRATLCSIQDDDNRRVEPLWRTALAAYEEAGEAQRADIARGRLGVRLCQLGQVAEGRPMVEESVARLRACDDTEVRVTSEVRLATALAVTGQPEEALAAVEAAERLAAEGCEPMAEFNIALARARCLQMLGRLDEVVDAASRARDTARRLGGRSALSHACFVLGVAHTDRGEPEPAVEAFEEVIAIGADPRMVRSARSRRANLLAPTPRAAEVVDDLVELIAEYVADGADMPAAYTRFDLAIAYHSAGQPLDAAEAAEEAVRALDQIEATVAADRCRYLLATVYHELDQPEPALALLDELAERLDGFDNLPARGQMHEEAAQILYALDRDATAAARFTAAADCYRAAGLLLDEVRARRWAALSLRWAGDMPAAMTQLGAADGLAERLPTDEPHAIWEHAMLGFDGARVLLGEERLDQALYRLGEVPQRFRSIEAFGEALQAEALSGELLIRLGRPVEAEGLLRGALGGVPEKSDLAAHVAWLLTEALEAQGRTAEAEALRREHGFEADEPEED